METLLLILPKIHINWYSASLKHLLAAQVVGKPPVGYYKHNNDNDTKTRYARCINNNRALIILKSNCV
jgi:hypothetical protein